MIVASLSKSKQKDIFLEDNKKKDNTIKAFSRAIE